MILSKHCWYPAFVIYRWRHVLWTLPLVGLLGLLAVNWNRLRFDHAMAVFETRAATSVLSGPEPARVAQLFEIIRSPELLGRVARQSALTEAWKVNEVQAAERLRAQVFCEILPGGALFEVKVRKIRGGDSKRVCEEIQAALDEKLQEALSAKAEQAAVERRAVLDKAVAELQAELEANRAEFFASAPTIGHPGDVADRFESLVKIQADRRLLEQLESRQASDCTVIHCFAGGPLAIHEAPHWAMRPATYHLQQFGIAAAWTFGLSVVLAVTLAYLLEALISRKVTKEDVPC